MSDIAAALKHVAALQPTAVPQSQAGMPHAVGPSKTASLQLTLAKLKQHQAPVGRDSLHPFKPSWGVQDPPSPPPGVPPQKEGKGEQHREKLQQSW